MVAFPEPGVDTLYKAIQKRANGPNAGKRFFGTKNPNPIGKNEAGVLTYKYDWMSYKEVADTAKFFAAGAVNKGLVPDIEHEGKKWRFIGIQAKNMAEWGLIHMGNMHMGTASVGLYDTLGEEAVKFIINQTKMTTVALTSDLLSKYIDWKRTDKEQRLVSLHNIIIMDSDAKDVMSLFDAADGVGLKVYKFSEIVEAGKNNIDSFSVVEP